MRLKEFDVRGVIITNRTQNIDKYFSEISKYQLLSPDEETELFKKGDADSIEKILKANLRFVVSCAKKYQHYSDIELIDLISAGNIGLIEASTRFDHTRGFKFISYAVWWIRQHILIHIQEKRFISIPKNVIAKEVKKHNLYLKKYKNDVPKHLETSVLHGVFSLDNIMGDDESQQTWADNLVDNAAENFPIFGDLSESLQIALMKLETTDRDLLVKYYRLYNGEDYTLQRIGEECNLTRERVRQKLKRAEYRLRRYINQIQK